MNVALSAPTDIHSLARFSGQMTCGIAPGLGSTATTPLIEELVRRGHQVTVFTLSPNLPKPQTYQWGRLRIVVGPTRERHLARNLYRPEIGFLRDAIHTEAPPFVHAHWTYEYALGALRAGLPTLTTIHDLPWSLFRHYRDPHRAVRLLMAYEVALRGAHFTAVSRDAATHFHRYLKPGAKIDVIPNGVPERAFELGYQLKRKETDPFTFATVIQGWIPLKNPKAALRAFSIVQRTLRDARLLMFGAGYEEDGPAQRWAVLRGLNERVVFVGTLPHDELLRRLSEDVDAVVHTSLNESFSMAAAEAMALNKPVIGGKHTTGVREVLGFGEAGALVDVTDPSAIAAAMIRLARDARYREQLANNGHDRAFNHYRLRTNIERYEAMYNKISHE